MQKLCCVRTRQQYSASLDYFVTSSPPYLHQFSTISGGNCITNAPEGHQKIRAHFLFDVKHCGKFKARLVADGHLTKEPMETVYSGVVSIRNLRLGMFLAELNILELWGADVGNAYLQALTREKLYIVGGPEFEELQGHVLVMYKALYGTRSGGACWHDNFFDILHDMGFKPSKADPDIWMKS